MVVVVKISICFVGFINALLVIVLDSSKHRLKHKQEEEKCGKGIGLHWGQNEKGVHKQGEQDLVLEEVHSVFKDEHQNQLNDDEKHSNDDVSQQV